MLQVANTPDHREAGDQLAELQRSLSALRSCMIKNLLEARTVALSLPLHDTLVKKAVRCSGPSQPHDIAEEYWSASDVRGDHGGRRTVWRSGGTAPVEGTRRTAGAGACESSLVARSCRIGHPSLCHSARRRLALVVSTSVLHPTWQCLPSEPDDAQTLC